MVDHLKRLINRLLGMARVGESFRRNDIRFAESDPTTNNLDPRPDGTKSRAHCLYQIESSFSQLEECLARLEGLKEKDNGVQPPML